VNIHAELLHHLNSNSTSSEELSNVQRDCIFRWAVRDESGIIDEYD
jgi:hypothetical protein